MSPRPTRREFVAAAAALPALAHAAAAKEEPVAFFLVGDTHFLASKDDPAKLAYGQSITDACLGWEHSVEALDVLGAAVKARRG